MISSEQLRSFEDQLKQEQDTIQEALSTSGVVKTTDPNDFDSFIPNIGLSDEDNALEVSAYLNRLSTEEMLESRLKEIQQALVKIETKNFGICEDCHKEIELKKLEVNPAADFCINCGKKH